MDSAWSDDPSANIGVATGGELVVLDVDPRNGGDESLAKLLEQFGPLPETPIVETGGGGLHYYFTSQRRVRSCKPAAGLDLQGEGKLVVGPGSIHKTGREYGWRPGASPADLPLAVLPAWLRECSAPADDRGPGVASGRRNDYLTSRAGRYRRDGLDAAQISELLHRDNARECKPPLESAEVTGIAESVARYPAGSSASSVLRESGVVDLTAASTSDEQDAALRHFSRRVAELDPLGRELARRAAIEHLEQVGMKGPGRVVDAALTRQASSERRQGASVVFPPVDPWPEPVILGDLLSELRSTVDRYIVLPPHASHAIALWIAHTHVFVASEITPRLAILSPAKRCGKSTTLAVLSCLVGRPLSVASVTASVLFRVIEAYRPTLLVDEADTFLGENDELRGMLNSGHEQSGRVLRCDGDDHEPRAFSTWAPVAIAAIGKLPDTLMDRSVVLRMRRKADGERVAKFRRAERAALSDLARKCARWGADGVELLANVHPDAPKELNDRQADNWEPLLAIAHLAGSAWLQRGHEAALALSRGGPESEEAGTLAELLLADVRTVFEEFESDKLTTVQLLNGLKIIDDHPWREQVNRGRGLDAALLAKLLRPYAIRPRTIRTSPEETAKGYSRVDLEDAWLRYLPKAVTSVTDATAKRFSVTEMPSRDVHVTAPGQHETPCESAMVTAVTGTWDDGAGVSGLAAIEWGDEQQGEGS